MGIAHSALEVAQIAILGDEELTSMLAIQLQKMGVNAHVSTDNTLDPMFSGVIDLRSLDLEASDQIMGWSQACFETAQALVQQHPSVPKVYIHVTQLGGDFGFQNISNQQALIAGAAGVIRTAQQEWRNSHCKILMFPKTYRSIISRGFLWKRLYTVGLTWMWA